jgi:DNA-binding NtrC family response regulator
MAKPLIFVVDDEPDILELYQNLLEHDYEVVTFGSPSDFLAGLKEKTPDLAITDFKMPLMSGLEMVKMAQSQGHSFPFILLSGNLDKKNTLDAVNMGAFRVLEKPTDYDSLSATIDQLLMEHEIVKVRTDVRELVTQLRELYGSVRIIMSQYIPSEVLDRLILETDAKGQIQAKSSFEGLLEKLETRLDQLLKSEKMLVELKTNKFASE